MAGKVSNRNAEDRDAARLVIAREVLKRLSWVTKDGKPCHFTRPSLFKSVNAADRYQTNESLSKSWQLDFMRVLCNLRIATTVDDGAGTSGYMVGSPVVLEVIQTHPDLDGLLRYMLWPSKHPLSDKLLLRPEANETDQEVLERVTKSIARTHRKIFHSDPDPNPKTEDPDTLPDDYTPPADLEEQVQAIDPIFVEAEPDLTEEEIEWITKFVEELDKVSTNQVIRNALKREQKPGSDLNKLVARCLRDIGFRSRIEDKGGRRVKFFIRHDNSPAPVPPVPNVPTTVEPPPTPVEKRHIRKDDLIELVGSYVKDMTEVTPGEIHNIVKSLAIHHDLDYIPYGELSDFIHKHLPDLGFVKDGTFTFVRKPAPLIVEPVQPELIQSQVSPEKTHIAPTISEPNENLFRKVSDIGLSTRTVTCLHNAGINLVGEMIQHGKFELRSARDLGDTSFYNIVEKLKEMGLSLGTRVENWHGMLEQWGLDHPPETLTQPQSNIFEDSDLLTKTVREVIGDSPCVINNWLYEKVTGRPSWELSPYESRIISGCAVKLGFSRYDDPTTRLMFFCVDDVPTKEVMKSAIVAATTKTRREAVESAIMTLVDGRPHSRKELFHGNEETVWQFRVLDIFLAYKVVSVSGVKNATRYVGIASKLESLIDDEVLNQLVDESSPFKPKSVEQKLVPAPQSVPQEQPEEESTIEDLLDVIQNHSDTIKAMDATISRLNESIKSLKTRMEKLER
jgi:hypothetical protein